MATVTGLTKERMLEIEAASVVGGLVDAFGHLILSRHDDSTIDAGSVIGPAGGTGPTGSIMMFAAAVAPAGWIKCDGASLLRAGTYAELFAVIGTTYGSVDGTHFNVPNLKGKVVVGLDAAQAEFDTLGETGGSKTHILVTAEMPSHDHGAVSGGQNVTHTHSSGNGEDFVTTNGGVGGGSGSFMFSSTSRVTSTGNASAGHNHSIPAQGSGTAHNNLQPYMAINYIIKI